MVDATINAKHILAFAHVRPGFTAKILRVAGRLFLYYNPRPNISRWMLTSSLGIEPGIFVMTVIAVLSTVVVTASSHVL